MVGGISQVDIISNGLTKRKKKLIKNNKRQIKTTLKIKRFLKKYFMKRKSFYKMDKLKEIWK